MGGWDDFIPEKRCGERSVEEFKLPLRAPFFTVGLRSQPFRGALTFALMSALAVVAWPQPAWAQTETVLYAFPSTKSGFGA